MPSATKLQRWTDLLASLLRRRYAATFEELSKDVPAYSNSNQADAARMRMFERDKDELRALGIAIETVPFDEGESTGYRLEKKGFYMSYLFLSTADGRAKSAPRRIKREGYRALHPSPSSPKNSRQSAKPPSASGHSAIPS